MRWRQWRIQVLPEEGAPTPCGGVNIRFCQNFPKTAWNRKNLDHRGGGGRTSPCTAPLDPPLEGLIQKRLDGLEVWSASRDSGFDSHWGNVCPHNTFQMSCFYVQVFCCIFFGGSNYGPQNEVLDKVMFLHLYVILFTGGGVFPIACWDTPPWQTPQAVTPLGLPPPKQTPLSRHSLGRHPPGRQPLKILRDMIKKQAVCIILECIIVNTFFRCSYNNM